jgi:CHAT domain-containing protein
LLHRPDASHKRSLSSKGGNEPGKTSIQVRQVRVVGDGRIDGSAKSSITIDDLSPLPDTREEVQDIARVLGADVREDVFIGKRASEHCVKSTKLSDRKILVFASHALLPGDLDGLNQPAIALSSPQITGSGEDGLLTAEEILNLNLDCDLVVLSACNTGSGGKVGTEAFSGLGRSFFYAGTRAILLSMWPVETTSARRLTTGLFQVLRDNSTANRARALQMSALKLIDSSGLQDPASGRIVSTYAHPIFWAPFVIIGDNGA